MQGPACLGSSLCSYSQYWDISHICKLQFLCATCSLTNLVIHIYTTQFLNIPYILVSTNSFYCQYTIIYCTSNIMPFFTSPVSSLGRLSTGFIIRWYRHNHYLLYIRSYAFLLPPVSSLGRLSTGFINWLATLWVLPDDLIHPLTGDLVHLLPRISVLCSHTAWRSDPSAA